MYSISSLFWAWQYNSLSSELVKTLKYKGSFDISDEIADLLIHRLQETGFLGHFSNPVFVPVPLHKKKEKERGFNQCVLIGKRLSEKLEIPIDTDLLLREIYEKPQAEKNKTDRKKLSKETFTFDTARYISRYKGMEVILIDDVVTTGTTLDTASTSIKSKNRGIFTSAICLFRGRPDYSADSSAS